MSHSTAKPPDPCVEAPAGSVDAYLGRLAGAWVARVQKRPVTVILLFLIATVAAGAYAVSHLGINSSEIDIFSRDLPVMQLRARYFENFPVLRDPIVVVVDAATPDLAHDSANRLAERLRGQPERFPSVYQPDGGKFFDEHGLLYLSVTELQDLVDRLSLAQPFLARLSRNQSIAGLLGMLDEAGAAVKSGELEQSMLDQTFDSVSHSIDGYLTGNDTPLSWQRLLDPNSPAKPVYRRFLLVEPTVDFNRIRPAEDSLAGLREAITELGLDGRDDVRVRATGTFPLAYEESEHVREQATWAGLASLVLVTIILIAGFRSTRLVLCSIITLLVGLVWTAGFAAAAIGHLNLVSVAFGVLFIGLSIDFAIHLSVQFSDELGAGVEPGTALRAAATGVGGSLIICAVTTAVAFLAFVPTDFTGVAELGLIAGTGMFIGLITNFTLLPALILKFASHSRIKGGGTAPAWLAALSTWPVRHASGVLVVSAVLTLAALVLLPDIRFDTNPIRIRDPSTDSVQVFNEILQQGDAYPWNLNVVTKDLDTARETAARLEELPETRLALTLADFVPDKQEQKLDILDQAALMLLPSLDAKPKVTSSSADEVRSEIDRLEKTLDALTAGGGDSTLAASARRLRASLGRLQQTLAGKGDESAALEKLRGVLFGSLPGRLQLLRTALQTEAVTLENIPAALKQRMIGKDGRARIEVFPKANLNDQLALEAYVAAIQSVKADAFGEGLFIVDSGRVVIAALQQALITAAVVIMLILLALWRNILDSALVAAPLVLATLLTVACSVIFGIAFNFANVIIVPLLLGMGIDSGIHMIHRVRAGALPDGNVLRTGTARAVLLSALTTMASFGTLGFSSHPGIASLGELLTLGITLVLLCNLVVLPALVRVTERMRR